MSGVIFHKLNTDWNAEPNDPGERVSVTVDSINLSFFLNPWAYQAEEGDRALLTFSNCSKWRLGPTNDEGWHRGHCRYSALAPAWGEFYEIVGPDAVRDQPNDWQNVDLESGGGRHFLFYLRDNTFECLASDWSFDR